MNGLTVSSACPSQLDPIETTMQSLSNHSYQDYRLRFNTGEWQATIEAYGVIDDEDGTERLKQLVSCHCFAWFAFHVETRKVTVMSNSCNLRWCPICSRSKSVSVRQSVHDWIKTVRSPKFLTLTLAHCKAPLSEQIDRLYQHYRNFRRHKFLKRWTRGGVWFFQVKRSKNDNLWHPHLHIVLDSDYMSKFNLSQEWFQTTSSSNIIDIRRVDDLEKVSEYVSKYVSRPASLSDFTPEDGSKVIRSLHGRRLCGSFGSGRGVSLKLRRSDDAKKWQTLADWRDIIPLRFVKPSAKKILLCWLSGCPLPADFVLDIMPVVPPENLVSNRWTNELSNGQALFQEFL